jgi:hypothetical protein
MNDIEQLLARDVAAVKAAVVVTEADLRDAQESVSEAFEVQTQRRRRRLLLAVAAAAVVLPTVAYGAVQVWDDATAPTVPAHEGEKDPTVQGDDFLVGAAPTPELLDGVWRVDGSTLLVLFRSDGTVQYDDRGTLYTDPKGAGTYRITGDQVSMTIDSGPGGCAGARLAMRAAVAPTGEVHVVTTSPAREGCAPGGGDVWALQQVLPTRDEGLASLVVGRGGWQVNTSDLGLLGDWMAMANDPPWGADGGGYLLEMASDGTYTVGTQSAVSDRGTWQFDTATAQLSLTSSAESPSCRPGDRWVLGELLHRTRAFSALRGSVKENDCGGDWANHTWILMPQER